MTFQRDGPPKWDFGFHGEELNTNYWWLQDINTQKQIFAYYWQMDGNEEFRLTKMYECLEILEAYISPKLDNDEVEKNLDWMEEGLRTAWVRNSEGEVISYQPNLVYQIKRKLIKTFKLILVKMEHHGLLTMAPKIPGDAMGQFKST